MTMHRRQALRFVLVALLGLAAGSLIACGSSTKGLIPASAAGPLQSDFEEVQSAAEAGDGNCTATEQALAKTSQDFAALPASVDAGLRSNLNQGIRALRTRALALCAQLLPQSTTTTETKTTTSTPTHTTTTPTSTQTTPTQTTPTTTTPTVSTPTEAPHGGTPAPGETPSPPAGPGGGTGVGENGNGAAENNQGGAQEGGK
jgi:hypothetical protein